MDLDISKTLKKRSGNNHGQPGCLLTVHLDWKALQGWKASLPDFCTHIPLHAVRAIMQTVNVIWMGAFEFILFSYLY